MSLYLLFISQASEQGDYSSHTFIHGLEMLGLSRMKTAKPNQIKISYKELTNGAEITYTSGDTELFEAIIKRFDAQLSDHTRHAMPGHIHDLIPNKP